MSVPAPHRPPLGLPGPGLSMFKLACPSCGAEVAFRSATSAIAVCEYCHSTLLREADAVRDVGKMSAVLEDYSPLRVGVSGVYSGRAFTVIRLPAALWRRLLE